MNIAELPILIPVSKAVEVSGLSRTEIYDRLKNGAIEAKKMRRSTLVVTASLFKAIDDLPSY